MRDTDGEADGAGLESLAFPHPLKLTVILCLAMVASKLVLRGVGMLAVPLRQDLGISQAQVGLLATTGNAAAVLLVVGLGSRVGRLTSRNSLLILFGTAAIGTVSVSVSPNYGVLLVAVWLCGAAGAAANPITNQAIARLAAPGSRGRVLGIKQSGVMAASLVAGVLLPPVADVSGWRVAVGTSIALPLLGLAITAAVLKSGGRNTPVPKGTERIAVRHVLRHHRFLLGLAGYATIMGIGTASTSVYLPGYAHDELGYSVTLGGFIGASLGLAGVTSRVVWGGAVEHRKATLIQDLALTAVGTAITSVLVLAATSWHALVWIGAIGFGVVGTSWTVTVNMAIVRDLPPEVAATGSSITELGFSLGLMAGPAAFGVLVDGPGYQWAWSGIAALQLFGAAIMTIWHFSRKRRHRRWRRGLWSVD